MIGILIITHETIGIAYRKLAQHFFPKEKEKNIIIMGVRQYEDHEDILCKATKIIKTLDSGNGVLVITDIFGATPCNAIRKLVTKDKLSILTGLNAPMMIKATQYYDKITNLTEFTHLVKNSAIDGIIEITTPQEGQC